MRALPHAGSGQLLAARTNPALATGLLLTVALGLVLIGGLALGWAWFAACSIAFGGRLLRLGAPVEIAEGVPGSEVVQSGH